MCRAVCRRFRGGLARIYTICPRVIHMHTYICIYIYLVLLSCSVAPFFPFCFGGCPTKSGLPQKGLPFFQHSLPKFLDFTFLETHLNGKYRAKLASPIRSRKIFSSDICEVCDSMPGAKCP